MVGGNNFARASKILNGRVKPVSCDLFSSSRGSRASDQPAFPRYPWHLLHIELSRRGTPVAKSLVIQKLIQLSGWNWSAHCRLEGRLRFGASPQADGSDVASPAQRDGS